MHKYRLSHLSDGVLSRELAALVSRDRATTAELLAHIAEFNARRLYAPAGYAYMHLYCVHELHMSEDVAFKRIRAAGAARRFPVIYDMLVDGRLHVTGVMLLARRLTPANANELLAAATHRTRRQIEHLLAERFPHPDLPTRIVALAPTPASASGDMPVANPGPVDPDPVGSGLLSSSPVDPDPLGSLSVNLDLVGSDMLKPERAVQAQLSVSPMAPASANPEPVLPRITPIAPQRYALQLTIGQELHDKLEYARSLLSHQIPSGEVVEVLERALDLLIVKLEKAKFAATDHPRAQREPARGRHIPAEVKRQVQARDQGRCTFVSEHGHRCDARRHLEYDHIEPVARGGKSTVQNIRLRCRTHNQYEADCAFGSGFMHEKRARDRRAATNST